METATVSGNATPLEIINHLYAKRLTYKARRFLLPWLILLSWADIRIAYSKVCEAVISSKTKQCSTIPAQGGAYREARLSTGKRVF